MNKPSKNALQQSKLILEELEERRLFSGGIEGLIATDLDSNADALYSDIDGSQTQTSQTSGTAAVAEQQSQEIVFVDAGVDNYQQLVDDLHNNADTSRNIEVVVLEREQDGIEQISSFLQDRDDLDAIHIISHGSDGSVQLGNSVLDADTLQQNNHSIALWANAFAEAGDILIYGCNLAQSELGQSLIADLGSLTLTDVAASDDLTGHASLGGDWNLELNVGSIETQVALSAEAQQQWQAVLVVDAEDAFSGYPAGDLDGNAGGTGFTDAWTSFSGSDNIQVVATGLTHPTSGPDTTDAIQLNQTGLFDSFYERTLASPYGSVDETIWASFLIEPQEQAGSGSYMGVVLGSGGYFNTGQLFFGYEDSTFKMNNWSGGGTAHVDATAAVLGETAFVVLRLDISSSGNDTATLFVNPNSGEPTPSVSGTTQKTDLNLTNLDTITIVGGAVTSNPTLMSGLRIGSSFADVAPASGVNEAPTFGSGVGDGVVTTDFVAANDAAQSVTIQPDGKVLVAGTSGADFALTRYNADGTLDTGFSADGMVITSVGGQDFGMSVTLQSDGKILMAGTSNTGDNNFALVRYNADGSLDTGFDGDGMVTTDFSGDDWGQEVTVQPDGKILVTGYSQGTGLITVARYDTNGALDTSFDGDGKLTIDIGSGVDRSYSITVQADGKILVAGGSFDGGPEKFSVARYNANGSPDTSFDGDGKVITTISGSIGARIYSVTEQPDGKILVAGSSHNGSNMDFALVRYNANGSLDTTFDGGVVDGIVTIDIGTGTTDWAYSATLQPDGKILVAGSSGNDFALVRLDANGSLDTSFDTDGKLTTDIGGAIDKIQGVTVQADGKILVAGSSGNDFAVVQYNADGSPDTSFDLVSTLDANPTFIEDSAAVVLDANVTIFDTELSGADNFDGASLTLVRDGGANGDDAYSATGTLAALTESGSLVVGGTTIGTVTTNSAGTMVLTFNSNATNTLVNQAMQQIAYSNANDTPPASVQINWSFDDGNTGAQGAGGALTTTGAITVNITNVAPVISASGAATVNEGEIYTLNLSTDGALDTWTINWGDGTIDTIAGNLTSANHVYNNGGFTNNITISATDASGTYYDSALIVGNGSAGADGFLLKVDYDPVTGLADIAGAQVLNTPTPSDLDWAADVIIGPNGDIYATGYQSDNIIRFDGSTGAYIEEFVSTTQPVSIAFGADGNLYVASDLGNVKRFDGVTGAYIDDFLTLGYTPEEMTFSADGDLYIGQYNPGRIFRYDSDTGAPLDGGSAFIDPELTGTTADDINYSEQFTFGPDGNIYVASMTDGVIQRYSGVDGSFIDTFATPGLTGAGWPNGPTGVAFGPDGHLYVTTVDRVERYDGTTGVYMDDYIPVGGGLDNPWFSAFTPNLQVTVNANSINEVPTFTGLDGNPTFVEGGAAVVLDSDVTIYDAELSPAYNFDGATLTLVRNGGASIDDVFSATGTLGALTQGGNLVVDATTVGTVTTNSAGTLLLTFNSNATNLLINSAMQQIAYSNSSGTPPASAQLDWTFDDGNTGAQGTGGALNTTGSTTVNIAAANDVPVATGNTVIASEDVPLVIGVSDFSYTDTESDSLASVTITGLNLNGGTLTHSGGAVTVINGMTITAAELADLNFTSASNDSTDSSFTYTVNDAGLGVTSAVMNITVNAVNDVPVATGNTVIANEDVPLVIGPSDFNFTDVEGDSLASVTITGLNLNGGTLTHSGGAVTVTNGMTITAAQLADLTFTSASNDSADSSFTYTVNDAGLGVTSAIMNITVNAVNDVPVATGNTVIASEDVPLVIGPSDFNFTDVESDSLASVTITGLNLNGGTLTHSGGAVTVTNGMTITAAQLADLTFTSALNDSTNTSFTYTVNDAGLGVTSAVMNITVNAVNDAPVMTAWFNDAWDTRKGLTINAASVAGNVTDFPVLITLNTDPELAAQALANGDDILFTAADGITQLAHEIEFFDETTGELRVWVKTDLSGSVDTNIYMYFGNAAATNQENIPGVWDNYVGVYHLGESPTGAPGEIIDSSGSGNHGTTEGAMDGADSVSTTIGQGLAFDGTDDMIRIPDSVSLDGISDEATFSLWINFVDSADGDTQIIMSSADRYTTGATDGYEWASQNDGDHFFYPDAGLPDANYNLGVNPFTNGAWHHLAATMDFAAKEVKIYVDGTPMIFSYEGVPGNWTTTTTSNGDLLWGGNPDRITRYFLGMMDEIRIADVARSQEWIQTEVNNQSAPGSFFSIGVTEDREDKLTDIAEDNFTSTGDSVLSIITSSGADRITDADSGAVEGIAVTVVDNTNGQWQYDANADGTWLAFGSVSDTSAVLLDTGALIRFVPNADYNGSAGDLTFHAWDRTSGTNGDTGVNVSTNGGSTAYSSEAFDATLNVTPVNDEPVATGNTVIANEDVPLVIGPADFNFTDVEGDALVSVTITGLNLNGGTLTHSAGTVTVTNGMTITAAQLADLTFTSAFNDSTDSSFTYTVNDAGLGVTSAVMNITVNAVNDVPVATGNTVIASEDVPLVIGASAFNFTDVESDGLASVTITGLNLNGGTLTHSGGAVTVTNGMTITAAQLADLTFTSASNDSTDSSFTYTVNDAGTGVTSAVMNITVNAVNDVPVATGNTVIASEDVPLVIGPADFNFTDVESDSLASVTITGLNLNGGTLTHSGGAVTVTNGMTITAAQLAGLTFTSAANDSTDSSFTYTVNDAGLGVTSAVMNITVNAVNDVPVATGNTVIANEDVPLVIGPADFNFTDVESDSLASVTITGLNISGGTLTHSGGAVTVTNGMTITAAQLADLTFTSAANDSTDSSFTYTVNDAGLGVTSAVMNITVNAVNDVPVATGNTVIASEDVPLVIGPADFNFTDVESDSLASVTITGLNLNGGTLTHSGGAVTVTNGMTITAAQLADLTFTSASNDSTDSSFTYTVNDAGIGVTSAVMNITVNAVNDVPVATGNTVIASEDVSLVIGASDFNFTDVESDSLASVTITGLNLNGGTLTHSGGAVTVTNGMTITAAQLADLTFTSAANDSTDSSFTYTVNDAGTGITSAVMNITVIAVNDVPVATGNTVIASEDVPLVIGASDFNFTDVEGDSLASVTITGLNLNGGTLTHSGGAVTVTNGMTITAAQLADLTFTSAANDSTDSSFTYTVNDAGTGITSAVMNITVIAVNDVPVATGNTVIASEDVPLVIGSGDFNFTDVESDSLASVTITGLNLNGGTLTHSGGAVTVTNGMTITAAQLADLTFTSASNDSTDSSFTYTVNDAGLGITSAVMNITVNAVNDVPVATGNTVIASEDVPLVIAASDFNFTDVESDSLASVTITGLNLNGGTLTHSGGAVTVTNGMTITAAQLADLTFTSAANDSTDSSFTYTVNDAGTGVTSAVMNITVNAVNDVPVATGNTVIANEDVPLVIGPADFDFTDVEGDSLVSVTITGLNLNGGTLTHSGGAVTVTNGMTITAAQLADLTFTSASNDSTDSSFTYTVNDAGLGVTSAIMNITVNPVNDVPVATGNTVIANEDVPLVIGAGDFNFTDIESDSLASVTITGLNLNGGTLTHSGGAVTVTNGMTITAAQLADLTFTSALNDSTDSSFTYTVNDAGTGVTSAVMNIIVNAFNNLPVIGGVDTASITEDLDLVAGNLTAAGALTITDADVGESSFIGETITGAYGNLVIDAAGNWSYSADNSQAAIQSLRAGESVTDTLSVTTADGSTHDIAVTIDGAAEAAPPPVVEPPVVEPPPEEDIPPPEEEVKDEDDGGEDGILEEITRLPQDSTPPVAERDEPDLVAADEPAGEVVNFGPAADKQVPDVAQQPQVLQAQNLNVDSLSLQVSDDEALNEQYELELLNRIDSMHLGMDSDGARQSADDVSVQIVVGSTASLTVGIVSWVLRGGALLASFMSTVPLLNRFDPLPILKTREDEEDVEPDEDDDTGIDEHAKKVDNMFSGKDGEQS